MTSEGKNERDNWIRLTLRLPPELHSELVKESGVLSLNAVIVQKLDRVQKLERELRSAKETLHETVSVGSLLEYSPPEFLKAMIEQIVTEKIDERLGPSKKK